MPTRLDRPWLRTRNKRKAPEEQRLLRAATGVRGSVDLNTELALFIDEAGTVRHVRIDGAPLLAALEEAARSAFLSARFTPGESNGAPVRSLIRVAIRFDPDPLPLAVTAAAPATAH